MIDSRWVRSPRVLWLCLLVCLYFFIYLQIGLPEPGASSTHHEPLSDLKPKVVAEIRELERQRYDAQLGFERVKGQVLEEENKLKSLRQQVNEARGQLAAREKELAQLSQVAHPPVAPPRRVLAPDEAPEVRSEARRNCGAAHASCFDQSRCPLTSGFAVFFVENIKFKHILDKLRDRVNAVTNPNVACVWVQVTDTLAQIDRTYWHGDGGNNVILLTTTEELDPEKVDAALVIGPNLQKARRGYDFAFPFRNRFFRLDFFRKNN